MSDTPHFSLPFRFIGTSAAENEQDSVEDIADCVQLVMRYHPGQREMLPDFGTPEIVFMMEPVDKTVILDAISTWEPRAAATIADSADAYDPLIDHMIVSVSRGESQ